MAILASDYRKQQDYMLQRLLAESAGKEEAHELQKMLACELRRRSVSLEDWQDKLGPDDLYKKFAQLEAERKAEQAKAKLAATQAALNAPHMQCTLSTAVDMWIVKFGDGWVPKQQVTGAAGEMNWQALGRRLAEARRMEEYDDFWRVIT